MKKLGLTFGIDEAGRGPLAGPVSVAVFGISKLPESMQNFPKGKDSKKMTEKEREYWFEIFRTEKLAGNLFYEINFGSSHVIDVKGIVFSIKAAMEKCLVELERQKTITKNSKILFDGTLFAPLRFVNQQTIIKGDEKEMVIACASIVAKVSRDRLMKRLAKEYPEYGFEKHKGYGTLFHREKIAQYGQCKIHRKSYIA